MDLITNMKCNVYNIICVGGCWRTDGSRGGGFGAGVERFGAVNAV